VIAGVSTGCADRGEEVYGGQVLSADCGAQREDGVGTGLVAELLEQAPSHAPALPRVHNGQSDLGGVRPRSHIPREANRSPGSTVTCSDSQVSGPGELIKPRQLSVGPHDRVTPAFLARTLTESLEACTDTVRVALAQSPNHNAGWVALGRLRPAHAGAECRSRLIAQQAHREQG
jgi:hypothetical protein